MLLLRLRFSSEAVHKRRSQSGRLSSTNMRGGSLDADSKKLPIFRNLLCVRTDKGREIVAVQTFYRPFVRTSSMKCP